MKSRITLGSLSGVIGIFFRYMDAGEPGSETLPYVGTPFQDIMLSHDPFVAPLFGPREHLPFVDLGAVSFSLPPSGFDRPSELLPTPVFSRGYDPQYDDIHNASTLHRVFEFLRSDFHPNNQKMSGENCGFQANYRGSLLPLSTGDVSRFPSSYYPFGLGHAGIGDTEAYTDSTYMTGSYANGPTVSGWLPNEFKVSYKDYVKKFLALSPTTHDDPLRYHSSFDVVSFDDFGLGGMKIVADVKCQFYGTFGSVACTYHWRYTLDFFGASSFDWYDYDGAVFRISNVGNRRPTHSDFYRISFQFITCDVGSMDTSPPNFYALCIDPPTFCVKGLGTTVQSSFGLDDYRVLLRNRSYSFSRACRDEVPHLKDANYLSTVASVEDMQRGTNSDILQTLSKLPDAASMIPKIHDFIKICEDIHHKSFNIVTIKDLVGLAATTNLQSNFQWQPFQRFLTEQLPEVIRGIRDGWSRDALVIGRGSYAFSFDNGFLSFPSARLTARSKIVVDTGISSVFATALGLDGLGIMPKPSNLWDLIPFSFAVNWITGVGANIRRAEYGLFLLAFPTYGVHTLTIEAGPSVQDLNSWKLSKDPTDPFRFRWYYRDVSRYIPFPVSGKYPFGLPTGSIPITLVASLLYSLIVG